MYERIDGYWYGDGGEFTLFNVTGVTNASYSNSSRNIVDNDNNELLATAPSFQTFCLESSEAAAASFYVVGSAAVSGGNERDPILLQDRISLGTAWLYSEFAKGTLNVAGGNYFGSGNRSQEADKLQKALWWLEGEHTNLDSLNNPYYRAAVEFFDTNNDNVWDKSFAQADAPVGYLGVYVLQNFRSASARDAFVQDPMNRRERAQDFLWYHNPPTVPDGGATVMLLGGAMLAMGALRRKLGPRV
ncbi:hypothetical protein TBR22_A52880 [Luteitalea sp. TBR-22]|nr:hypothetical protein TBR22_A52880 [Luteitalea sp. TBR-22]